MTEINSDRVNKDNFTFIFKRYVEHHNQQIIDQLIKQRKKDSFDVTVSELKTPLSLSELNVAWSFFENNFEILEDLVYESIAENYIDAHEKDSKSVANDFDKVGG